MDHADNVIYQKVIYSLDVLIKIIPYESNANLNIKFLVMA